MTDFAAALVDLLDQDAARPDKLLPHQTPPAGKDWSGWLLLGGRGAGKSHALSAYLRQAVRDTPKLRARIIAPTLDDAISSNVYGPAGILAIDDQVEFHAAAPGGTKLVWPGGAECRLIGTPSMRDVDRLRATGNRELDLWEEAAANPMLDEAWKQAALGRRLGWPRWVAATTPRALPLLRDLLKDPKVRVSRATSRDNPHNPESWMAELDAAYAGTRLYRQEVLGEILEDVEGALWQLGWLDRSRVGQGNRPALVRIAVGVDPPSGSGTCGIVVAGLGDDEHVYVLEDVSVTNARAELWAGRAVDAARRWSAPLIAENDQGGDMVRAVLKAAGDDVLVKPARARGRGGKAVRAEPVALLWEKEPPTAHMVGTLAVLEDQLTTWDPGDKRAPSPDRLDAMVWAITWLTAGASWNEVEVHSPATVVAGRHREVGYARRVKRPGRN